MQCADVFRCKEVRVMISSKRHVVILMAVELVYVRTDNVRTSISTDLPGECASCRDNTMRTQNTDYSYPSPRTARRLAGSSPETDSEP